MSEPSNAAFTSAVGFDSGRVRAAAVYCSDGRFGEAFDDFLTNGLSLPGYDRVALPGGPAALVGHPAALAGEGKVVDELRFLVEAHDLDRVVLIQHAGCGFYAKRLGLRPDAAEQSQQVDLARAAHVVRHAVGVSNVEGFFARPGPAGISFEKVELF